VTDTLYCIFLDPDRPPEDGTFVTWWKDLYQRNKNMQARHDLSREVDAWCRESFGPHCPPNLMDRRWTSYVNLSWKIERPEDAILFKLRWCQPVSWMKPAKYSEERARANRMAWVNYDGESYDW
jgi:hypothetical protein